MILRKQKKESLDKLDSLGVLVQVLLPACSRSGVRRPDIRDEMEADRPGVYRRPRAPNVAHLALPGRRHRRGRARPETYVTARRRTRGGALFPSAREQPGRRMRAKCFSSTVLRLPRGMMTQSAVTDDFLRLRFEGSIRRSIRSVERRRTHGAAVGLATVICLKRRRS